MADKGMEFVTPDGEVLQDIIVKLNEKFYSPDADIRIAANPTNLIATKRDFRIYVVPPDREPEVNEFGELIDLRSSRVFSKVFQSEDPDFSKDIYYKFWYKLCIRLDKDTNIIFARKPVRHYVTTNEELIRICKGSRNVVYKFLKECKENNLIGRFTHKGNNLFVLNPRYVLNGYRFPLTLYNLFNKKLKNYSTIDESKKPNEQG